MDLADRHGVEVVVLLAADLAPRHEVSGFEHCEVLHHSEPGELGDRSAQLAQREPVLLDEAIEKTPARGLGERSKHVVHVLSKGDSRVTCQLSPVRGPRSSGPRLSTHEAEPIG